MLTDETQQPTETQAPAPLSQVITPILFHWLFSKLYYFMLNFVKQNYKFNQDELLVLRECNSESFYQRSLPLMTVMGSTIYFGISRGTFLFT